MIFGHQNEACSNMRYRFSILMPELMVDSVVQRRMHKCSNFKAVLNTVDVPCTPAKSKIASRNYISTNTFISYLNLLNFCFITVSISVENRVIGTRFSSAYLEIDPELLAKELSTQNRCVHFLSSLVCWDSALLQYVFSSSPSHRILHELQSIRSPFLLHTLQVFAVRPISGAIDTTDLIAPTA